MSDPDRTSTRTPSTPCIEATPGFVDDVRTGLAGPGPKVLPPKYFYDELGSALFEALCRLPEYGLSRAGERLLERHARALAPHLPGRMRVVELGCGAGRKLRLLLEGLGASRVAACAAIDLSRAALVATAFELSTLRDLVFEPVVATFDEGLRRATSQRAGGERVLVLFLGSNLGNYASPEADRFLASVRARLTPGDAVLLGLDLAHDPGALVRAYDDALGITAAFNKNVLVRMNRELGARFDVRRFAHEARWNDRERRIEMHLKSLGVQHVEIPGAGIRASFADGETIWTESSHKYLLADLPELGRRAGLQVRSTWVDEEWPFVHALFAVE